MPNTPPPAWILERTDAPRLSIWGLSPTERLRRSLRAAGCARSAVLEIVGDAPRLSPSLGDGESALLFRADFVFDDRLVRALVEAPGTLLVTPPLEGSPGGEPAAAHIEAGRLAEALALLCRRAGARGAAPAAARGLARRHPAQLASAYTAALRKLEPLHLLPARPEDAREIERRLFGASYKGKTDLVTKWVWPRPAAAVTRALARRGVHPNAVTLASWALAILAFFLFARGAYGAGLAAAWLMTFLDTVDGKLARVTLTSSRLGNVLDHGLDLVHPPFWWLAWGLGLPPGFAAATWISVGGYFVGRLLEGLFLLSFKIETHSWRPLDALFRTITARRNPNLILLTVGTLGGRPDLGLVMVAIWTICSLGFHGVRLGQAHALRARGGAVAPFDEAPGADPRPSSRPGASAGLPSEGGAASG